jgi:hypothetical protein
MIGYALQAEANDLISQDSKFDIFVKIGLQIRISDVELGISNDEL